MKDLDLVGEDVEGFGGSWEDEDGGTEDSGGDGAPGGVGDETSGSPIMWVMGKKTKRWRLKP